MGKYIKKFETHNQYTAFTQTEDFILPNVSYCKDQTDIVHYNPYIHDYSKDYFTFVALQDTTFSHTINNVHYSLDNGETWQLLISGETSPTIQAGKKIMFKANLQGGNGGTGTFSSTGRFNVEGNIMSLYYENDFVGQTGLRESGENFKTLFSNCANIIIAQNLILPSTTLYNNCYEEMFKNCTSLVTAPELPATTLAQHCYGGMFDGCTNLVTAPSIIPAITASAACCTNMFKNCTSLETAPELPATTLETWSYAYMFEGCSNLRHIKMLATDISMYACLLSWVNGVAANGTFVKNSAATWDVTGKNGIPNGWTVETASA